MPSQNYETIRDAILNKQCVSAVYDGKPRKFCPHVIGHGPDGEHHVFVYQFGGLSSRPLQVSGSEDNWRCMKVSGLSSVKVYSGPWHTSPDGPQGQTCVGSVDTIVRY